jgi:hypothetical protein
MRLNLFVDLQPSLGCQLQASNLFKKFFHILIHLLSSTHTGESSRSSYAPGGYFVGILPVRSVYPYRRVGGTFTDYCMRLDEVNL